jgi:hypothetical protein
VEPSKASAGSPTTGDEKEESELATAFRAMSIVGEIAKLEMAFEKKCRVAMAQRDTLTDAASYFLEPEWRRNASSGDDMVESLLEHLAMFDTAVVNGKKMTRSKEQREMHLLWVMACLPQIYGKEEYAAKLPLLRKRFNMVEFHTYVAIFATRRFGKTFAMAMFVAAFMWSQRSSVVNVFSLSQRTSEAMKKKIKAMVGIMLRIPLSEINTKKDNMEEFRIINKHGEESVVYSYPCSSMLRGMGSEGTEHNNIVLLEEASFVKKDVLLKIVSPLMLRRNSVFLTISTLGGTFDTWKSIAESKDEQGHPLFILKTYSTVCDDCIEKGIPERCIHKQDLIPPWQDPSDVARVKVLMKSSKEDWLREAMGVEGGGGFIPGFGKEGVGFLALAEEHLRARPGIGSPFESGTERIRQHIAWLEDRKRANHGRGGIRTAGGEDVLWNGVRRSPPKSPVVDQLAENVYRYCFIAVDPAAGSGAGSNYAIVSMVWERDGVVVIVGMEDFPTPKHMPASHSVVKHLDVLRRRFPQLKNATFVVAPECNMGNDANELAYLVMQHRDKTPMHKDRIVVLDEGESQYGIRTGDKRKEVTMKETMCKNARAVVDAKKLRFLHNFVTVCNELDKDRAALAARFVQQLQVYGAELLPARTPGASLRRIWHGKHGGQHDDLAMVFQLGIAANQLFFSQPHKYGISPL